MNEHILKWQSNLCVLMMGTLGKAEGDGYLSHGPHSCHFQIEAPLLWLATMLIFMMPFPLDKISYPEATPFLCSLEKWQ